MKRLLRKIRRSSIFTQLERIPVRVRLSLGYAICMGVTFAGIGFAVFGVVEDNIMQSLDAALVTSARSIRDVHINQRESMDILRESPFWEGLLDEFFGHGQVSIRSFAQLVDMSGKVHARTRNVRASLPVTPLAVARAEKGMETFETFHWDRFPPLRQVTLPIMVDDRFTGELIQVGTPMESSIQALSSVRQILWIALPIGLAIAILVGYLLTSWSLGPVTKITNAAARLGINELNLRLRLPPANDELKLLTRTFNEMLDRLEDAFTRLRRYPGDVSHELRTPLAVLRGEAELALRRERSPEEYKSALKTILNEAANMSKIVEDLLLLARAQGKSIALRLEETDLAGFLNDLAGSVRTPLAERSIVLDIRNDADATVRMSPSYFHLALKNLLLNAARHSAPGSRVELSVKSTSTQTDFVVRDTGEGIPKESLPYIFDPFYRADTVRNRASGGVGIGLSLVKALVKLHGASLKVESEINKGAAFTVSLPKQQPTLSGLPAAHTPVQFVPKTFSAEPT